MRRWQRSRMTQQLNGENHDAEVCATNSLRHARPCAGHPRLALRGSKAWMAGTKASEATPSFGRLCPAMTNVEAVQAARLLRGACHRAGQRPDPLARNDADGSVAAVIARSAQRDEAISATRAGLDASSVNAPGADNPRN